MKLAYYGLFDKPSDCENWIANAFIRAGVLVHRWQRRIGNNHTNFDDFLAYCTYHKIDSVLINKANEITPRSIQQLKSMGIKVYLWTFDWMQDQSLRDWFVPVAKECDLVFMTDGIDNNNFYRNENINRIELHQGYDKDVHFIPEVDEVDFKMHGYDIVFMGSAYTERRQELIYKLKNTYGDRFVHIGQSNSLDFGAWGPYFRKVVHCSKIIIGDNYLNSVPGYWSDRIYLTLACGGFFMPSYVQGLEREFKNGINVVWWNSFGELIDNINYYLDKDHEGEREEIKMAGYNTVLQRDSYDERIAIFLQTIKELFDVN